jgi:hypothetical protein
MPELSLEGRPLAIFPCRNKKPVCEHGYKDAVSDPDAIRDLFRRYPSARQIGVATGEINGLDVLDIDAHRGGNAFWEENRHRIPLTRTHQTPHGGRHLLFRHAPGLRCSTDRIAPGIEVKADGGSFVWHPTQFYPVIDAPVAEWPDWLLELAREKQHKHKTTDPIFLADPLVVHGIVTNGDRFVPKPLHDKIIELMPGARPLHQRRVRGILRVLVQTRQLRNNALRDAAIQFGDLINVGIIARANAESLLFMAAVMNGYVAKDGDGDAWTTIRSGLDYQTTRASANQ